MAALGDISKGIRLPEKLRYSLALTIPIWPNVSFAIPPKNGYVPPVAGECEIVILNDSAVEILTL